MKTKIIITSLVWSIVLGAVGFFIPVSEVSAHGERNQEPYLRMRTIHFYDVTWSTDKVRVNDDITVTGKFLVDNDWPHNLPPPDIAFLGNGTPGPVFARVESYINGNAAIQSVNLEVGREYEFKSVMRARIPGRHHVHPMVNAKDSGALLGPGSWVEITGSWDDFVLPVTTIDGTKIENLETWGVETVVKWHLFWFALALFWIFWWLLRPLIIPRYMALQGGHEDKLITSTDRKVSVVLLVVTLGAVFIGYQWAEQKYPLTTPLQAGRLKIEPLPLNTLGAVKVFVNRATYDVPGRSMKLDINITNTANKSIRLGEFTTSNLRFIDRSVSAAVAGIDQSYPKELIPYSGIVSSDSSSMKPGETRRVRLEFTDVAWEAERLTSFLHDPDNRVGGLFFFFTPEGERIITNFSGPIVPVFTKT